MAVVAVAKAGTKVVDAIGGKGTSLKIGVGLVGVVVVAVVFMLVIVTTMLGSIMAAISGEASAAQNACNGGSSAASPLALKDIPAAALDAYQKAGAATGVNWTYIAAIGKVESGHGSANGSTLGADGQVTPPILGPVLNGSGVGGNTSPVYDTDRGVYDGNAVYDRAMGPMQFMPGTWLGIGQDGNFDGKKDPQNIFDAALATGMYLKRSGAPADMTKAILAYNHSVAYVALVQNWSGQYGSAAGSSVVAVDLTSPAPNPLTAGSAWEMPLTAGTYKLSSPFGQRTAPTGGASSNHEGQDFAAPIGTPIKAVGAGKVIAAGPASGYGNWVKIQHGTNIVSLYGHMATIMVKVGDTVTAGQVIALVGNEGVSTGPHLHFGIYNGGVAVDPLAFLSGNGVNPANDAAGCGYPADSLPPGVAGKVLTFALSKLGNPYVYGGTGPFGYDCSGFTQAAYAAAGITIPRTSEAQWAWAQAVTVPSGQEQAGDLIFFHGPSPGHVGIVLDPATKTFINAPSTGDVIKKDNYNTPYWAQGLVGFKRMPGGGLPVIAAAAPVGAKA